MNNRPKLDQFTLKAFPLLAKADFIKQITPAIPMSPDTFYDIFKDKAGNYFALIKTDYPDPLAQSDEFKYISDGFRFSHIVRPYHYDQYIEINAENNDLEVFDIYIDNPHQHIYLVTLNYSNREDYARNNTPT